VKLKFGAPVRTWGSLPTSNFEKKIDQGDSPIRGKFLPKIRNFLEFKLLKPIFLYL